VPSWYFGDGATLANQVVAQTGDPGRIVPLDPILTAASVRRPSGANVGIRIGHTVTRRVLATFTYDQAHSDLELTNDARSAITATNDSYQGYWEPLLTRSSSTNVKASSALTTSDHVADTIRIAAGLAEVRIATLHGWTPYVAAGGGIAVPSLTGPAVTLVGNYQFNIVAPGVANGVFFKETDQLQITYESDFAVIGIFGVGVERDVNAHIGVRADFRTFLNANALRIIIDTQPVPAFAQVPPSAPATTRRATNPSVQITTNPTLSSSLSPQGVGHFVAYKGTGNLPSFSGGVFFRF